MDIITGYTGSPHVTAEQDRDVNIGIFGAESYVLRTGSQLKCRQIMKSRYVMELSCIKGVLHQSKRIHMIH